MDKKIKRNIEVAIKRIVDERLSEKEKEINLIYQDFRSFLSDRYD